MKGKTKIRVQLKSGQIDYCFVPNSYRVMDTSAFISEKYGYYNVESWDEIFD
jgi:hypothetical protein